MAHDLPHPPPGIRATPSGLAVVGVGLLDNLQANRVLLTYLAVLFVFLFLAVRLRSVIRSLLSLVPVFIAVGVASLVAYGLSLKLSPTRSRPPGTTTSTTCTRAGIKASSARCGTRTTSTVGSRCTGSPRCLRIPLPTVVLASR